ncbi:MAG TPA: hypothetical protein VFY69_07415, partial [Solirubrobacterales bacterium]|nr:hypothetical protein [Solirubrobacterales bacterium]
MKNLKILGLAILAVAVSMAFAGSASAASLTSPMGTYYVGELRASANSAIETDGPLIKTAFGNTVCEELSFEGLVGEPGNPIIPLTQFAIPNCSPPTTITVINPGTLELQSDPDNPNGNGLVTWSEAEITILTHRSFFGFPYTEHCIYYTDNTPFGTLTGGTPATLNIGSFKFLNKETDSVCAEPVWTGSY